jgi:hypothetical protein
MQRVKFAQNGRKVSGRAREAGGCVDGLKHNELSATWGCLRNASRANVPIWAGAQGRHLQWRSCDGVGNFGVARQFDDRGSAVQAAVGSD